MPVGEKHTFRFGPFELDTQCGQLRKDGVGLKLQGQPIQILEILLQKPGQLVTREEIRQRLWTSDTFVDFDHSLNTAVKKLRQTLGDEADTPRYIETLPKRGYRFIAPVDGHSPALEPTELLAPAAAAIGTSRLPWRWALLLAGVLALVAVGVSFAWFLTHRPPSAPLALKERRLTANASEDPLTQGVISPDGKYLAYGDQRGLHLKLIQTGEITNIPQPPGVSAGQWWPNAWFPDSTKFITAGFEFGQQLPSAWVVSVIGGAPRKLRDDADPWSVSPDGALIAFGTGQSFIDRREIWVMGPQGEEPHRLASGSEDDGFYWTAWSPDGQRIAYGRFHRKPDRTECSIETRDLKGSPPTLLLSDPRLCDIQFMWLPDGHFLYTPLEPEVLRRSLNLWEIRVDTKTGHPVSKPRRITNWVEVSAAALSVTSDGKRLAVSKMTFRSDVYVAELGRRIDNIHRLTFNENDNRLGQWMPDSKAVLLWSNRNGTWDIFKQALGQAEAELVATGADYKQQPVASPDGSWILYLSSATDDVHATTPVRIMRVPTSGGAPQLVLEGRGIEGLACARSPATICVFSERTPDDKQLLFSRFDPMRGRGLELTKINLGQPIGQPICCGWVSWDLSADGSRLTYPQYDAHEGHIQILPLSAAKTTEVTVKDLNGLWGLSWAVDGKSLFAATEAPSGTATEDVLLRVDLEGRAQIVWQHKGPTGFTYEGPRWVPSPNGRYLAVSGRTLESNVWLMENF